MASQAASSFSGNIKVKLSTWCNSSGFLSLLCVTIQSEFLWFMCKGDVFGLESALIDHVLHVFVELTN